VVLQSNEGKERVRYGRTRTRGECTSPVDGAHHQRRSHHRDGLGHGECGVVTDERS
jgi:hypothetical protein